LSFAIDYVQNDPASGSAPLELLHGAGKRNGLFSIESAEVVTVQKPATWSRPEPVYPGTAIDFLISRLEALRSQPTRKTNPET
jgi:hypothetical protein